MARLAGFDFCGISRVSFLEEEAPRLEKWLKEGKHGKMAYMENHFDLRLDPGKLVPGSKSVITLLCNYYTNKKPNDPMSPKISQYAYGEDYHYVLKDMSRELFQNLEKEFGKINGRIFTDSAPVMDKVWAGKAGAGWIGKNSNLINRSMGSFFFIAEIISDLELQEDGPIKDYCGSCTACIDHCPTEAITPYSVDGSKCISYLTIELKDELIPKEFSGKMENWMFGCDICQDVCPWNRFASPNKNHRFIPKPELLEYSQKDWAELSQETFNSLFKLSAVKRTGFNGLKRNILFLNGE